MKALPIRILSDDDYSRAVQAGLQKIGLRGSCGETMDADSRYAVRLNATSPLADAAYVAHSIALSIAELRMNKQNAMFYETFTIERIRTGSTVVQTSSGITPATLPSGMVSPASQRIIQIEVTNVCPNACSNCTRLCGHPRKPFFLPLERFRVAVESLQGYSGMVGVMGGEPTLHPDFRAIVEHIAARRPDPLPDEKQYQYIQDFNVDRRDVINWRPWQKGLWTSLGPGYRKHYELIQQTFRYQCINDHRGGAKHIGLLVPRKDIGVPDDEWKQYRDSCWVQRLWSASVTPRGAYFCEVAASIADLFGLCDGWKLEPEWWKRTPSEFGEQLELCEFCSACLPMPSIEDKEGTDLVSARMAERLKQLGSSKPVSVVMDSWNDLKRKYKAIDARSPYMDGSDGARVHKPSGLEVGKLHGVMVCKGYDDYMCLSLPRLVAECDEVTVLTSTDDIATQRKAKDIGAHVKQMSELSGNTFCKGKAISAHLATLPKDSWVLLIDADIVIRRGVGTRIRSLTLNPGALYYTERIGPRLDDIDAARLAAKLATESDSWSIFKETFGDHMFRQKAPWGFFQLFNTGSSVLAERGAMYPDESISAEHDDAMFAKVWYGSNRCAQLFKEPLAVHLPHGASRTNWKGRKSRRLDDDHWWAHDERLLWRVSYRAGDHFAGLWQLAKSLKMPHGTVVVEIGTMLGDGAATLSAALPDHRIITVDPGPTPEIQAECAKRIAAWPNITKLTQTSLEAAARAEAEGWKIGFVYLDGDHTSDGVAEDIQAWFPLIVKGGYIGGHDYTDTNWPGVKRAVTEAGFSNVQTFCDSSWLVAKTSL